MPEPLLHFVIPFFLMTMSGLAIKKATLFSLLAVLPDADVLFHVHRSMSHSIFFILAICIPVIIIAGKFYKEQFNDSIIATLSILSHPFMDLFTGQTPIFWPLFNKSIFVVTELTTNMDNILDMNMVLDLHLEPTIFYQTTDADAFVFTSLGVAVSMVLLAGLALKRFSIRNRE